MIQESGATTLHLFKDGAEVQALRQRIDYAVLEMDREATSGTDPQEPAGTGESATDGPGGLSALLARITVEDGIGDIAVREDNLDAVKAMLADSTVQASIRAFNLANLPPAPSRGHQNRWNAAAACTIRSTSSTRTWT